MKRPQVSIVIPAYNEERYLAQCLISLASQKTSINYEVIVVDNNSDDLTIEVAQSFKNKLNLRVVREINQGRGAARARGFNEALGMIILSTDADTSLPADWVETLVRPIKGEIIATTTSCKINDGAKHTNTFFNFYQPTSMVWYKFLFGYFWLNGFSFGILKSAYERSGGFNPKLQAQEDIDLSLKVAKIGKVKFINKPVTFSGRRFKQGLIPGLYQYLHSFVRLTLLKKQDVYLSNIR